MLDPKTACLWFAGKELYRDKKLMDTKSIGTNEKTMIIAKLTKVILFSFQNILQ